MSSEQVQRAEVIKCEFRTPGKSLFADTRLPLPRHKALLFWGCLLPEGQVQVGHLVRTREHQDLRVRAIFQEEEVGDPKGSLCCGVTLIGERAKASLSLTSQSLK